MTEKLNSREAHERFTYDERHIWQERNRRADEHLRGLLEKGDGLRATKAECCSKEANFIFDHWEKGWIVSTGGASISPGSVYSVNRQVISV